MMSNARPNNRLPVRAAWLVVALATLALTGCASAFDVLPEKAGGLPASAPARPAEPLPTPNVYEVRPTREARPLDNAEQKKLESELTTLRDSQRHRANPQLVPPPAANKAAAAKTQAKKGDGKVPAGTKKPAEPLKLTN
jgi:hypothetical protein